MLLRGARLVALLFCGPIRAFARPFAYVVRAAWLFYAINTHLTWIVEENFYVCVRKSDSAALQMQRLQHVIYVRQVA